LAQSETENPSLLMELPNLWEVVFLPEGFIYKTYSNNQGRQGSSTMETVMTRFASDFQRAALTFSLSCCSMSSVLDKIRNTFKNLHGEEEFKTLLEGDIILNELFGFIKSDFVDNSSSVTQCFVSRLVTFCLDVFEGRLEWAKKVAEMNPVQIIVAGEKIGCSEVVRYVEQMVLEKVIDSFKSLPLLANFFYFYRYNRSCDYYRLLIILPELKQKIPRDYQKKTEVYSSWRNCLFYVWIEVFGEEETLRQADATSKPFDIWEGRDKSFNDCGLLHIAVQIGSVRGVKKNAWPGYLSWKEKESGQTALEVAQKKWGSDHEITRFLAERSKNLFHSGCRDHLNSSVQEISDHSDKTMLLNRREAREQVLSKPIKRQKVN